MKLSELLGRPVVIRAATEEEKRRDPGDFEDPTVVIACRDSNKILGMIELDDLFDPLGYYLDRDVQI